MDNREFLKESLEKAGLQCPAGRIDELMVLLSELKKWNRTYNLSALKKDSDIIVKHFIDSLLYMKALPEGPLKIADVGSGAGFPGIPLKILRPELDMTLMEPTRKKASFQRHIIRTLGLERIGVMDKRIEEAGRDTPPFDIIVSRATFSLEEFLAVSRPYIKEGGLLIVSKGPKVSDELEEAGPHVREAVKEIIEVRLPFSDAVRKLVVLKCNNNLHKVHKVFDIKDLTDFRTL